MAARTDSGLDSLAASAGRAARWMADKVSGGATELAAKWSPADAGEFVRDLAPHAREAARKLGVSVRAVLAQAALETGWGRHMPHAGDGSTSFNLFGIKAGGSWDGDRVGVPTLEFEQGVAVRRHAQFRAYDSPSQSFNDYANLLAGNDRYKDALGRGDDVAGFAEALRRGGYATDPAYARKVAAIADSPTMRDALAALKDTPGLPSQEDIW